MSDPIITVEKLGKRYSLRHQQQERYTALRDVIAEKAAASFRFLRKTSRRQDNGQQNSKVSPAVSGQSSDIPRNGPVVRSPSAEDFWAIRDVSFEVKQGEAIGIIGRNGAGKSTLLKILSRITDPTEGKVQIKGRVASLLEVGTGFHPELTGRENIFLNGAVLGMTRAEIKAKFDEIVAFAEVEKFLDTPVKRYSSGMYVRLAFAVAAHLEPDILVVDEVLAVGDAGFQQKCLGKMQDVTHVGRTVLFVSHNMAAIRNLTRRCIWLNDGRVENIGETEWVTTQYARGSASGVSHYSAFAGRGEHTAIRAVRLVDITGVETNFYEPESDLCLRVEFETDGSPGLSLDIFLCDAGRNRIAFGSIAHFAGNSLPQQAGIFACDMRFPRIPLAAGAYWLDVATAVTNVRWDHYVEGAMSFEVSDYNPSSRSWVFRQSLGYGAFALLPRSDMKFIKIVDSAPQPRN